MYQGKLTTTHQLVLMAILVAVNVVLSRFLSLSLWNFKIGFSFIPIVMAGVLLGPLRGGIVGGVADFVGAILFPIGAYFPGFTLTAFLTGLLYGLFLHKKQNTGNIIAVVLLTEILCSVVLNSLWISMLYGAPFLSLLPVRMMQAGIMGMVEIAVIRLIAGYVPRLVQLQKA